MSSFTNLSLQLDLTNILKYVLETFAAMPFFVKYNYVNLDLIISRGSESMPVSAFELLARQHLAVRSTVGANSVWVYCTPLVGYSGSTARV